MVSYQIIALCVLTVPCVLIYLYIDQVRHVFPIYRHAKKNTTKGASPRTILMWSSLWGQSQNMAPGDFRRLNCRVSDCYVTYDRRRFNVSDAVVFLFESASDVPPTWRRPPGQRWVFFTMEVPSISVEAKLRHWKNVFNWTMTYKKDSDIVVPYGYKKLKSHVQMKNRNYAAIMKAKPKMAAWMVSHCSAPSKRDLYVRELIKAGLHVDIYGECGPLRCPRSKEKHCMKLLNQTYKFYLSFENNLCVDYVTEKLFKVLNLDIIPIYRGGAHYTRINIPPSRFINTADFPSAAKLVNYLKYLDDNPEEYTKYFLHQNNYKYEWLGEVKYHTPLWCSLCERLHNPSEPVKFYGNLGYWWNHRKDCHEANDLHTSLSPPFGARG